MNSAPLQAIVRHSTFSELLKRSNSRYSYECPLLTFSVFPSHQDFKMAKIKSILLILVNLVVVFPSYAWRPCEEFNNCIEIIKIPPTRIPRTCEVLRIPCIDVTAELERISREIQAQGFSPMLEGWLIQSRDDAWRSGTSPIPDKIRQQLNGFYDDNILNRTGYKIGDNGILNLGHLAPIFMDGATITLIDVIVFNNQLDVDDVSLWVHELKHVQQYRDWGVRNFTIRYLRDPQHDRNPVESEARRAEEEFAQWRHSVDLGLPRRSPGSPAGEAPTPLPGQPWRGRRDNTPHIVGHWIMDHMHQGIAYKHDIFITEQNSNAIAGYGGSPAGPSYIFTWKIIKGELYQNKVSLIVQYETGAQGTTMNMEGNISQDGSKIENGTWSDDFGGRRRAGTWKAVKQQ